MSYGEEEEFLPRATRGHGGKKSGSSGSSTGMIVGIAVGGLLLVGAVILIVVLVMNGEEEAADCVCSNGKPVDNEKCKTKGKEQCKSCNTGFTLDKKAEKCVKKEASQFDCKCANGTPVDNKDCKSKGAEMCKACDDGFTLDAEKKTCGKDAAPAPTPSEGSKKASLLAAYFKRAQCGLTRDVMDLIGENTDLHIRSAADNKSFAAAVYRNALRPQDHKAVNTPLTTDALTTSVERLQDFMFPGNKAEVDARHAAYATALPAL